MNGLLKVFEMLLVSLMARRHYRKDQQEWFKYDEDEVDPEAYDSGALDSGPEMSRSISKDSNRETNYGTITEQPQPNNQPEHTYFRIIVH